MTLKDNKKCLNCGKEFPSKPKYKKKFCSNLCASNYWNKTHKEECKIAKKNFFKRNPMTKKEYFKTWNDRHPDYMVEWKKNNPKKWKEMKRRKRLNEMKDKEKYSARRWDYLKRKDKCEKCGSKEKLEFHHTNYKTHDGITLCFKCHRKFHNIIKMEENRK